MEDRLFTGKNPPDEITVNAKLRELYERIPIIFNIINILIVRPLYNKKIFIVCLKISELLKDKKFVRDFFKLSSYISIRNIIEKRKYKPPIHCIEDLHNIRLWSICFTLFKIVKPVDVKPDTDSKIAFKNERL